MTMLPIVSSKPKPVDTEDHDQGAASASRQSAQAASVFGQIMNQCQGQDASAKQALETTAQNDTASAPQTNVQSQEPVQSSPAQTLGEGPKEESMQTQGKGSVQGVPILSSEGETDRAIDLSSNLPSSPVSDLMTATEGERGSKGVLSLGLLQTSTQSVPASDSSPTGTMSPVSGESQVLSSEAPEVLRTREFWADQGKEPVTPTDTPVMVNPVVKVPSLKMTELSGETRTSQVDLKDLQLLLKKGEELGDKAGTTEKKEVPETRPGTGSSPAVERASSDTIPSNWEIANGVSSTPLNSAGKLNTPPLASNGSSVNALQERLTGQSAQIVNQIATDARFYLDQGRSAMSIQLKPESLGTLHLRVVMEENHLTARLQAETGIVKEIVQANLPQLKSALADHGITVDRFSVSVGGQTMDFRSQGQGFMSSSWQAPSPFNREVTPMLLQDVIPVQGVTRHTGSVDLVV